VPISHAYWSDNGGPHRFRVSSRCGAVSFGHGSGSPHSPPMQAASCCTAGVLILLLYAPAVVVARCEDKGAHVGKLPGALEGGSGLRAAPLSRWQCPSLVSGLMNSVLVVTARLTLAAAAASGPQVGMGGRSCIACVEHLCAQCSAMSGMQLFLKKNRRLQQEICLARHRRFGCTRWLQPVRHTCRAGL
jgi:hypothetical protein